MYAVFTFFFGIFDYATLKNDISAVIYSSISSYTSLERAKIKLSEKKYFRLRKPIILSGNFSGSVGSGSSIGAPRARSGALWVRKFGNLHIREILVVT